MQPKENEDETGRYALSSLIASVKRVAVRLRHTHAGGHHPDRDEKRVVRTVIAALQR